jgi:hypothetical protein
MRHPMTNATAAPVVARRPRPVATGWIPPAAGEMTVGHHLRRPVTVGTRRPYDASATTVGRHRRRRHPALAGTMIDATTAAVVMAETVASRPGNIVSVSAATRFRGLRLVGATSVIVSVLRLVERIGIGTGTGIVLVITIAEGTIRGTDIGIAGGDEGIRSFEVIYFSCSQWCSFVQDMSISACFKFLAAPSSARPLNGHTRTCFVSFTSIYGSRCRATLLRVIRVIRSIYSQ